MSAVFIPLHPRYADKISAGVQTVIFRKKTFNRSIERIVIYSKYPVKKVLGMVNVESVHSLTMRELFSSSGEKYRMKSCAPFEEIRAYYKNSPEAIVICISGFKRFKDHVKFDEFNFGIPANFRYLSTNEFLFFNRRF